MKKILALLLATTVLAGCGDNGKNELEKTIKKGEAQKGTIVVKDVYAPILEKNHPEFYQQWGEIWVHKINTFGPMAAEYFANQQVCKKITMAGLDKKRSKLKEKVVYFVNCADGSKHYVNMDQLNEKDRVLYFQSKLRQIDQEKYINRCINEIKNHAEHASLIDFTKAKKRIVLTKTNDIGVLVSFTHKNSFGENQKSTGFCDFADGVENFNPKNQFSLSADIED